MHCGLKLLKHFAWKENIFCNMPQPLTWITDCTCSEFYNSIHVVQHSFIHSFIIISIQPEGRLWQEPEPS